MPLQIGNWRMHSNGFDGSLIILSVTFEGVVMGRIHVNGEHLINGFWNEAAQELTFSPLVEAPVSFVPMFYKGYLFSNPPSTLLQPGQDFSWYLAGYFQVTDQSPFPSVPKTNSRRNVFGWYAQVDVFM